MPSIDSFTVRVRANDSASAHITGPLRSACLALLVLTLTFFQVSSSAQEDEPEEAVFERFLGALKDHQEVSAETKEAAMKAITEAQADDASLAVAMAQCLKTLYPELDAALAKTKEGDGTEGLQALYKLGRSQDRFLAAEANYSMLRSLFSQQRYEECFPFLERLRGDLASETLRDGDILYYEGIVRANSLDKESAIALLVRYLEEYPDASDRLRLSAQATLEGITGVLDGSIEDIADHMDFSHRRLTFEDSGEQTQEVQGKIVAMLDQIIQQAEEQQQQQQQQQSSSSSSGQQSGEQQAQQAGGQGQQPGGNANPQNDPERLRDLRGAAKSAWDDLRQRERANDALSGLKSKYPPRYRELVEQYYKDLQEGEEGGAAPGESEIQP